jgi:uncharacterized protein YegJ (DUF2314 family)
MEATMADKSPVSILVKLLASSVVVAALLTGCSRSSSVDKVVDVAADDAEMEAAIRTARGKLGQFWAVFEKPENGEKDFAFKVRIKDSHGVEHFWVTDLRRDNGKVYGKIANDPEFVTSVKIGQEIEIPEEDISDWMYVRNDKMIGNYTLRALFKKMPKAEVEKFKAVMEEP